MNDDDDNKQHPRLESHIIYCARETNPSALETRRRSAEACMYVRSVQSLAKGATAQSDSYTA